MSSSLAFRAPPLALLASEPLRAALDFFAARTGSVAPVEGDGHTVIVYPGLGAGALSTASLISHLRSCNFAPRNWHLGVNTGPDGVLEEWIDSLLDDVREQHARDGRKVSLVGWSLGGVYAREIAKLAPESVRQVITLATPHRAIADGNHAGTLLRMMGGDTSHLTPELLARLGEQPPVPVTSIYSKSDGVVSWRGCLQQPRPMAENIAVDAGHLGMPSNRDVLRIVAERLAQPEGQWRPFRRSRARATARSS